MGGIEAVLAAMREHGGDAAIQRAGCGALRNLASGPANRGQIGALGGLEAVLRGTQCRKLHDPPVSDQTHCWNQQGRYEGLLR